MTGSLTQVVSPDRPPWPLGQSDWAVLAAAVDRLDFGLAVIEDGVIRLANAAAGRIIGVGDDAVGRSVEDVVRPADAVVRDLADLTGGRFESFRARRVVQGADDHEVPILVALRAAEFGGRRVGVVLFVPEDELGQLGRHPTRIWADILPVAVGIADRTWHILAVSSEVYEILGRLPQECLGARLLDWVDPSDVADLAEAAAADPVVPRLFPRVHMTAAEGVATEPGVLLAAYPPEDHAMVVFALIGRMEDYFLGSDDRVGELEMRLHRIAAEVRAAGVLESFGSLPGPTGHAELADLTTRQWEILSRIAQGQRVPTIAKALFISPSTVRNHLAVIFQKFGVHNQAELIERLRDEPSGP